MKIIWLDTKNLGYKWDERSACVPSIGPVIQLKIWTYNEMFSFIISYTAIENSNTLCYISKLTENCLQTIEINTNTNIARGFEDNLNKKEYLDIVTFLKEHNENNMV